MIQEEQRFVKGNIWKYTRNIHINIIHQISSSQALHTSQNPYTRISKSLYKKQEKLIHDFILYTRNLLHEMESKYCIMGNINEDQQ